MTASDNGSETVVNIPGGGGSAVNELWYQAGNLAQVSSTIGNMYKTPRANENGTGNGWAQPITTPSDDYNNGGLDPILIPEDGSLDQIRIWFSAAATGVGTVSTPTVRIDFYKVQSDGTGRDSLATVDVPISPTGVGTFNNLGTNSPQSVLYDMTDITVSGGDLVGWEFTNQPGAAGGINAISRLQTSVHFVADS